MTREEAIKIIRKYECNKEHYDACEMAIEALEQGSILDKIRTEIDLLSNNRCDGITVTIFSWDGMKRRVFDIIDKYKTESEDKE